MQAQAERALPRPAATSPRRVARFAPLPLQG